MPEVKSKIDFIAEAKKIARETEIRRLTLRSVSQAYREVYSEESLWIPEINVVLGILDRHYWDVCDSALRVLVFKVGRVNRFWDNPAEIYEVLEVVRDLRSK